MLTTIDYAIIGVYLSLLIFIGFYLKRRASKNLESYLLGGKTIPWYMLGLSNASGMFDISGTVWLVAITVIYGLKSIYIPWLWPVFNQIFLIKGDFNEAMNDLTKRLHVLHIHFH